MPSYKKHQDKKELVEQLIAKGLNKKDIADQVGIPQGSITHYLKMWGLKQSNFRGKYDHLKDEVTSCIKSGMTLKAIAEKFSIPLSTVNFLIGRWARDDVGIFKVDYTDRIEKMREGSKKAWMSGRKHQFSGQVCLREQWVDESIFIEEMKTWLATDLKLVDIADKMGCSHETISRLIKKYNLYRGVPKGEKSPFWRGGHRKYRGPDFAKNRKLCLERDGYICQRCGKTQAEEKANNNRSLNAHHIIPYEISHDSSVENLISLCQSCHLIRENEDGIRSQKYKQSSQTEGKSHG